MSKLRCHISISLDGFVAGPNQSEENPLGEGGERLHDWVVPLAAWRQSHGEQGGEVNESARIVEESRENIGAGVMGRNMFGPVHGGAWGDEQWTGWWGDDPPYHYPVFILTHHPRDPVEMEGGTTFHFVTDGIESALEQARQAAAGEDVMLWGGADVARQYLAAGLLDELELHIVPVVLGDGARLFDNLGDAEVKLEPIRTEPAITIPSSSRAACVAPNCLARSPIASRTSASIPSSAIASGPASLGTRSHHSSSDLACIGVDIAVTVTSWRPPSRRTEVSTPASSSENGPRTLGGGNGTPN